MTWSKLKLNPSKTAFLLIGTEVQREKFLNNFPCLILGQDTNPSASAKNRIRKSPSLDLAKQIAVAMVSSKLDYCNSLFYITPENDIARLQHVQNCLAKVVPRPHVLVVPLPL